MKHEFNPLWQSKLEVMYASVDQFKGLERKVAIVVELGDELSVKSQRRDALLYVALAVKAAFDSMRLPSAVRQITQTASK